MTRELLRRVSYEIRQPQLEAELAEEAVVRLVISGHSGPVATGLMAGLSGVLAASLILRNCLHGLSPFDPVSYLGVAAILTIAALAASYVRLTAPRAWIRSSLCATTSSAG